MGFSIKKLISLNLLWLPLLIYLGERSYIAQDEGYYALQAKWILTKGNWIAPMWWNEVAFDRTIGIQWLIALSQKLFGPAIFVSHIPSILAAFITLYITNKLSKLLIGEKLSWVTSIILSTTYIWINNAHLSTQEMPLLSLEMLSLYSLIKSTNKNSTFYIFICSLCIGPALLLKSFMIIIPILAISPYVYLYRNHIFRTKAFWIGLSIGLFPFFIWIYLCLKEYGIESITNQINKINYLATGNQYEQPFYYYLWNIPVNTFPWIIFSIIGSIDLYKRKLHEINYILILYPILIVLFLSIFRTKTPYYPIQIAPIIAINANLGLQLLFSSKNKYQQLIKKFFALLGLSICSLILYLSYSKYINVSSNINKLDDLYLVVIWIIGTTLFINLFFKSQKALISIIVLGHYLAYTIVVQSGMLSDRSPEIKELFQSKDLNSLVKTKTVDFIFDDHLENTQYSNLIKLALYTPTIGSRLENTKQLNTQNLAWIIYDGAIKTKDVEVIFTNKALGQWKLVSKNKT